MTGDSFARLSLAFVAAQFFLEGKADLFIICRVANHRRKHHSDRVTWRSLKDQGLLMERHVLMAQALGMEAETIQEEHRDQGDRDSLLLEWVEDCHLAQFGSYVPDDGGATPESQAQDPSKKSLVAEWDDVMDNYRKENDIEPDDNEAFEAMERMMGVYEEMEKNTPMSVGEIAEQDALMLQRQVDLRKAAVSFASRIETIPGVQKMWLFGSVALPLWKEVPRFRRFIARRVKIYHHCHTIDLALEVTDKNCAPALRKAIVANCRELVEAKRYLGVEHHMFCLHLVDQATKRYLGMVCHFNQCPKGKPECHVPGCGSLKHVRILPWFKFKPHRLNQHNSLVLLERVTK